MSVYNTGYTTGYTTGSNGSNNQKSIDIHDEISTLVDETSIYMDYIFYTCITLGIFLIIYGIIYRFALYNTNYILTKATIKDISCTRTIVNRRRDEYHCIMSIEYVVDGKTISNSLQTYGNNMYYVGSEITIYVDRYNSVDIYVPYMSQQLVVLLLVFTGIVIILIASGTRYLSVN